jgi:hypothetical protein
VTKEPCSPPHSDSVASPWRCPSPFPRAPADSPLLVLLRRRQRQDEREGHHAAPDYAVDQRVGVGVGVGLGAGADTVVNVHPLQHYDSSPIERSPLAAPTRIPTPG